MPTYDYTCDDCGHEFEREQRITEAPIKECPSCGKLEARRMIGGGGFILKGGGWESDLYSGPSNRTEKAAAKSGDASPTESPKASESKTSSKKPSGGTASKSTDD